MPIRKEEQSLLYVGILHNHKGSRTADEGSFLQEAHHLHQLKGKIGLFYVALPQRKITPGEGVFGNAVNLGLIIKTFSKIVG